MHGGYGSEFEDVASTSSEKRRRSWQTDDISQKVKFSRQDHGASLPAKSSFIDEYEREERKSHFAQFLSLNAYQRHQKLVHDYIRYYGGKMDDFKRSAKNDKTDYDVLKENHKFIWEDGDDETESDWGKRLAKRYYDKLFKEYCICDVGRYKENKFAMRWRIEKEVISGKGQFICGARKCEEKEGLQSWEVNFGYIEHEEKKNALVKLRLCSDCSYKLNYHKRHKKAKREKKKKKKEKRKKKRKSRKNKKSSDNVTSSSEDESSSDEKEKKKDEVEESEAAGSSRQQGDSTDDPSNIWKRPVKEDVEKTRDEEFDEYLDDLFM